VEHSDDIECSQYCLYVIDIRTLTRNSWIHYTDCWIVK